MLIYSYDAQTKEYLTSREADADPEETKIQKRFVPLVPANATLVEPPECEENETAVFEDGKEWLIKPDYRKNFKKSDENLIISPIEKIGALSDGYYLVTNEAADLIKENRDKFKIAGGEVVKKSDDEYEAEQAQKEAERIAELNLTSADVERAIYKIKNMDFDDVVELVESSGADIDIKALKIELKANNFYRGNPYISTIGALMGFSEKQLTDFFETGDCAKLMEEIE